MDIKIYSGEDRLNPIIGSQNMSKQKKIFTPGEVVTNESGFMRGHGTYLEDDEIKASVAGTVERINQLIIVRPVKSRYVGEIGDVVIGRICEIQQKRWKVDVNARLNAVLLVSSVNLPGGELRRRSAEDERMMRKFLSEGDLISAEVQNIYNDGSLSLHTRSLKYGKLMQGVLVQIPNQLIKRCKTHFYDIWGVSIIFGMNGFIWIYPTSEDKGCGTFTTDLDMRVQYKDAKTIVRLRACILALAKSKLLVYDTSLVKAMEFSEKYEIHELTKPEVMFDIAICTKQEIDSMDTFCLSIQDSRLGNEGLRLLSKLQKTKSTVVNAHLIPTQRKVYPVVALPVLFTYLTVRWQQYKNIDFKPKCSKVIKIFSSDG